MKKCPKCNAQIEENARFCLYCMTSFEEKQTIETPKTTNKRWLYFIAAFLMLALIILSIFLFMPKNSTSNDEDDSSAIGSIISNSESGVSNNTAPTEQQNYESNDNKTPNTPGNSQPDTPPKNNGNALNNTSGNTSTDNNTTNNNTENNTENNDTENNTDKENDSTVDTPLPPETNVTYLYREAKYGDDFSVAANLENAVVITGVKNASADGKYEIPETIDGKKVIAIIALAFCDSDISNTVKAVIIPSTVKTIWGNAFANCYNLTDIYFKGNSIYTEINAFPETSKRNGTLTIHCSANCSDRNYRYYKNSASYYDAEYVEWNG